MKRFINSLILFVLFTLSASAQDFKLFYAKNVTDVTQFRNMTELDKQLSWREVSNGSIDGNLDDVKQVKDMLSLTRMKGLDDQRLFWKMRDEMLLCFRIDDPNSNNSTFRVEINYGQDDSGKDIKGMLTTRKYFFANMPLSSDSISINVWRIKDPTKRINFRYWVYDWDDDNVYIFQLDQKRQSTGDTYKMEYVTSYADQEGDIISESHVLELKETKFQSFYVPEGHSLTDVFFLTGNAQEGDVKLRMDMNDIHPGIDIDHQLEVPSLLPTFKLAKHENREMMNFNWVGTGLFEKYDTLFIKLFNEKAKTVSKAKMNVHRVDEDGELVNDNTLRYLGYDSESQCHKVLTFGHPAYVEILVDDYLPLVYRYKGAADRMTNIVSSDLCSAKLSLRKGNPDDGGIAIADQYFRYLNDESIDVRRISAAGDTISYTLCDLQEVNISGKMPSENVAYMSDAGNNYPKLYNNKPIEKYAQFVIVFSTPKGGDSPQCKMTVTEKESKKTHEANPESTEVIAASKFTNFTRDYYYMRYDMTEAIPFNKECLLTLSTPKASYNKFPSFSNTHIDNEKEKEKGEEKAKEIVSPKDGREGQFKALQDFGWGAMIPMNFKFSTPLFTFQIGSNWDFTGQTFNIFISGMFNFQKNAKAQADPERTQADQQKLDAARKNAKAIQNWKYKSWEKGEGNKKKTKSLSLSDSKVKYEDWVMNELDGLFKVQAKHVGGYGQIGVKAAIRMPLALSWLPDVTDMNLSELALVGQIGYGMVFTPKLENDEQGGGGEGDDQGEGEGDDQDDNNDDDDVDDDDLLEAPALTPTLPKMTSTMYTMPQAKLGMPTMTYASRRAKVNPLELLMTAQGKLNKFCKDYVKIDIGAQYDINLAFEGGLKSLGKRELYDFNFEKDKAIYVHTQFTIMGAAWAGLKLGYQPLVSLDFGGRIGAKVQLMLGWVWPFNDDAEKTTYWGHRGMFLGGAQVYVTFSSCLFQFFWRGGIQGGLPWLWPNNVDNPYHSKFPSWLPDKEDKAPILSPTLRALDQNELGRPLVGGLFYDANPHFLDASHITYNSLGSVDDFNDDHIEMATLNEETVTSTETLSLPGTSATQHMRSKRGQTEVVAYRQTNMVVDKAAVNNENVMATDRVIEQSSQIRAAFRQADGTWKQTVVTPNDGMIDRMPVVTAQEDGKAAVLYQHGQVEAIDPAVSLDSIDNQRFVGDLMLRTYDPAKGWSEPTKMFNYTEEAFPLKYDLVMRNDTVLTGFMLEIPNSNEWGSLNGKYLTYAWKALNDDRAPRYAHGDLRCIDFFMNRVGDHVVSTVLYERPDTLREIYIKTLNMDGSDDGLAGSDLRIGRSMPNKVKIITDRSDDDSHDFAVLWTEASTTVKDVENGNKQLTDYATVINAVRIQLTDTPQMTYPLTVAAERDSLQLSDFDGYLDDALLKVVYTLVDPNTLESVIMYNEKEFTNGFESDVTYSREALLGSSTLPVNVYITNTGPSTIKAATDHINGQDIVIPNVLVQPLEEQVYVVQYPITDDFDGYMQSSVEVEYANVFKASQQTRRRAAPRNLLRQRRAFGKERVVAGQIDCRVVSRSIENGVNTFIVEVIDRSSRGLTPGTAVQVGAYTHPSALETIFGEAKVLVHPEDFTRMGAVRKAFAELKVSGITEPIDGYIACKIVDLESTEEKESDDDDGVRVENSSPVSNVSYVKLLTTEEPTAVDAPIKDEVKEHRVTATATEGGILLGNLEPGDEIRVFSSAGWTLYIEQATASTHLIPLKHHDVYIISAAKEVFKFTY